MSIPVLFTSAGNDGFQAVFNALRGSVYKCIPLDAQSDVYGLYLGERGRVVPLRNCQDFIPSIVNIAVEEGARLLFPLSTEDQLFFAEHLSEFAKYNINVLVSDVVAVRIANDKLALAEFARENQIPQPMFFKISSKEQLAPTLTALQASKYSVVMKIAKSTGVQGVKIIHPKMEVSNRLFSRNNIHISLSELQMWLDALPQWPLFILTEYLPGEEYSVDLFLQNSRAQVGVVRKRFRTIYGLALMAEVVDEPDILQLGISVAETLGLNYIVNVQIRRDAEGLPKLMEINPRIPGSIDLTIAAGCNMPLWALQVASGNRVAYSKPKIGLKMIRHWTAIFTDELVKA